MVVVAFCAIKTVSMLGWCLLVQPIDTALSEKRFVCFLKHELIWSQHLEILHLLKIIIYLQLAKVVELIT